MNVRSGWYGSSISATPASKDGFLHQDNFAVVPPHQARLHHQNPQRAYDPRLLQLLPNHPIQVVCEVQLPRDFNPNDRSTSSSDLVKLDRPASTQQVGRPKLRARLIFEEVSLNNEPTYHYDYHDGHHNARGGAASERRPPHHSYYMQHLDSGHADVQRVLQPEPHVGPPDRLGSGLMQRPSSNNNNGNNSTIDIEENSLRLPSPSALLADATSYRERCEQAFQQQQHHQQQQQQLQYTLHDLRRHSTAEYYSSRRSSSDGSDNVGTSSTSSPFSSPNLPQEHRDVRWPSEGSTNERRGSSSSSSSERSPDRNEGELTNGPDESTRSVYGSYHSNDSEADSGDDSNEDSLSIETMVEPVPSPLIPRRRKRRYDKVAFDLATSPFALNDQHVLQPASNVRQLPGTRPITTSSSVVEARRATIASSSSSSQFSTSSTSSTRRQQTTQRDEAGTTRAIAEHGIEELRRCYFPTDRRNKTTPAQLERLEEAFQLEPLPSLHARDALADELGFAPRRVQIWFQNKRAKLKRMGAQGTDATENPKRE